MHSIIIELGLVDWLSDGKHKFNLGSKKDKEEKLVKWPLNFLLRWDAAAVISGYCFRPIVVTASVKETLRRNEKKSFLLTVSDYSKKVLTVCHLFGSNPLFFPSPSFLV